MTKKIKNKKLLIIILTLFTLFVTLISLILLNHKTNEPIMVKTLKYDYNVSPNTGIVLDNDILHFGNLPFGGYANRSINLTIDRTYLVKIYYDGDGNLKVGENDFILQENITKELYFTIYPFEKEFGHYNGTIFFEFYNIK